VGSVAVADVPDSPLSFRSVVCLITDADCFQPLGGRVVSPLASGGVTVAVLPNLVCGFQSHGRFFHAFNMAQNPGEINRFCATSSTEHQVGNGGHSVNPFPLGNLFSGRNLSVHVMFALHCDSVLLTLMVGSNVVHLNDGT